MIKTKTPVSYDPINPDLKAIVFAEITSAIRNDRNEIYTLVIKEWIEISYEQSVSNENGEMETQTFIKIKDVRNHQRVMTFEEVDNLTDILDSMFEIKEIGSSRRKKYTQLGHLVINNSENVRGVEWELFNLTAELKNKNI